MSRIYRIFFALPFLWVSCSDEEPTSFGAVFINGETLTQELDHPPAIDEIVELIERGHEQPIDASELPESFVESLPETDIAAGDFEEYLENVEDDSPLKYVVKALNVDPTDLIDTLEENGADETEGATEEETASEDETSSEEETASEESTDDESADDETAEGDASDDEQTTTIDTEPACSDHDLVRNGSFENPRVKRWGFFKNVAEWNIDLQYKNKYLEVQHSGLTSWGKPASEGDQWVELDGHGGAKRTGSVKIFQVIDVVPGQSYKMSFSFAPRPNTGDRENQLLAVIEDAGGASLSESKYVASGRNHKKIHWSEKTLNFVATSDTVKISFADVGHNNTLGTFLDNVRLNAQCE